MKCLVVIAVLALAVQARAIQLGPAPHLAELGLRSPLATTTTVVLDPAKVVKAVGGGDGVVTGPSRTLAWALLGGGALLGLGGAYAVKDAQGSGHPVGGGVALVSVGGAAALAGVFLLLTSGTLGCATCGVVQNVPSALPVVVSAAAALDPKRRSDLGLRIPVWALKF